MCGELPHWYADMDDFTELYSERDICSLQHSLRRTRLAAALSLVLGLGFCVLFCQLTTTANAQAMELRAVCTAIGSGWLAIYLVSLSRDTAAEATHAQMLATSARETLCGVLSVDKKQQRIPGSISFCAVTLSEPNGTRRCRVIAKRAPLLRQLVGRRVRLQVANGFVSAWEVLP